MAAQPAAVLMTRGGTQTVTISGANGALTVTVQNNSVTATVDQQQATIALAAPPNAPYGDDVLHVSDAAGDALDVPIRIAPPAATIAPTAALTVTGTPASADFLAKYIASVVKAGVQTFAGLQPVLGGIVPAVVPLAPGASAQYAVPVTVAGNGTYVDVSGTVTVTVQNQIVDAFAPQLLFYDDDPETVTTVGALYRGSVAAQSPVRLYYYHDADASPHRVAIVLQANSEDPTQVQIVDSAGGPNADVMSVGHTASRDFLLNKNLDQGTIVNVPQDGALVVLDATLSGGQGIAGVADLRVMQGGPVTVTVVSVPLNATSATIQATAQQPILPGDGHHRTGVFTLTGFGNTAQTYTVGGSDAQVQYGIRGPSAAPGSPATGRDAGDYGVIQNVAFTLVNPTSAPATVYLYEKPLGGPVRSTFIVDGTTIETSCARLSQAYAIAAPGQSGGYLLAPGQTYRLNVQTMTDGGSNYPLEIGITATPPSPLPASISGPDGCFPKS
jgi:hypothetical protein